MSVTDLIPHTDMRQNLESGCGIPRSTSLLSIWTSCKPQARLLLALELDGLEYVLVTIGSQFGMTQSIYVYPTS